MGAELVLRVNVYGLRHLTEHLLARGAIASGGSIVNIASLAGMAWQRHLDRIAALDAAADFAEGIEVAKAFAAGGPAAYVLSKEWVVSYTQQLAGRLLPQRIRVNSVSPGPVITPLFPYFETDAGAEQMAWMNEQVGRAAQPEDQAGRRGVAGRRRQRMGQRRGPAGRRRPVGGDARRLGRHQAVAGLAGPPPRRLTASANAIRCAVGRRCLRCRTSRFPTQLAPMSARRGTDGFNFARCRRMPVWRSGRRWRGASSRPPACIRVPAGAGS